MLDVAFGEAGVCASSACLNTLKQASIHLLSSSRCRGFSGCDRNRVRTATADTDFTPCAPRAVANPIAVHWFRMRQNCSLRRSKLDAVVWLSRGTVSKKTWFRAMQTFLSFLQDLGWGVSIGIVVLVAGGCFVYFHHWGRPKKKKRNASRATLLVHRTDRAHRKIIRRQSPPARRTLICEGC